MTTKRNMIHIFSIAYNEEKILPFFVAWYRTRFPECPITIYDNESTDSTVELARRLGCEVITYRTDGKLSDRTFIEIKNSCWKSATTDWVFVGDMDELVDLTFSDLMREGRLGTTVIDFEYWTVINKNKEPLLQNIRHGVHHKKLTSKRCVFNPRAIREINFLPGCHRCSPIGYVQLSTPKYRFFHYKFISLKELIDKYRVYGNRLSEENLKNNWSYHYRFSKIRIWWEWYKYYPWIRRFK